MIVDSKEIFKIAQKNKFAIPAANFVDINTITSYIKIAEKLKLPIILAYAQAHSDVLPLEEAYLLGSYYGEKASVPVILHLDHGEDIEFVKEAIDYGFKSVMIDASEDPLEENIQKTKEIVSYAKFKNVRVEAEIGHVGAGENYEEHEEKESQYTSVKEADIFVKETQVDSLAVSIGTAHGLYTGTPEINFELLNKIREKINIPLVLHGGSSSGDTNLNYCATHGMTKINIFTDFMTAAMKNIEILDTTSYLELQKQMKTGIEERLEHYYKVFETQTIELK